MEQQYKMDMIGHDYIFADLSEGKSFFNRKKMLFAIVPQGLYWMVGAAFAAGARSRCGSVTLAF